MLLVLRETQSLHSGSHRESSCSPVRVAKGKRRNLPFPLFVVNLSCCLLNVILLYTDQWNRHHCRLVHHNQNMNRLFGRGAPKEPPPNLTDCISNVSDISKDCLPLLTDDSLSASDLLWPLGGLKSWIDWQKDLPPWSGVEEVSRTDEKDEGRPRKGKEKTWHWADNKQKMTHPCHELWVPRREHQLILLLVIF